MGGFRVLVEMLCSRFETLERDYGDMARCWEGNGKAPAKKGFVFSWTVLCSRFEAL